MPYPTYIPFPDPSGVGSFWLFFPMHAGTRKLLKKIVKADESVFTGINNEPFDIEKYVRRA